MFIAEKVVLLENKRTYTVVNVAKKEEAEKKKQIQALQKDLQQQANVAFCEQAARSLSLKTTGYAYCRQIQSDCPSSTRE